MIVLKNIRNKIAELLTDSGLFPNFEILKNNFYSQNKGKDSVSKSILIYSLESTLEVYSKVLQEYAVSGDIVLEIILNSAGESAELADEIDQVVENVLGVLELAKFKDSGTKYNKVLDGTCSMFNIQSVKFDQDSQAEGFTSKATIVYTFKAIKKFTANTPTVTVSEINLDLEESSYTDSIGRKTTDEDLRIL
jgi:hypothetical protein